VWPGPRRAPNDCRYWVEACRLTGRPRGSLAVHACWRPCCWFLQGRSIPRTSWLVDCSAPCRGGPASLAPRSWGQLSHLAGLWSGSLLLRGRSRGVTSQASEVHKREIGITLLIAPVIISGHTEFTGDLGVGVALGGQLGRAEASGLTGGALVRGAGAAGGRRRRTLAPTRPTVNPTRETQILSFTNEGDTASRPLPATLPAAGVTSTLKTQ
jgi:hypothetical protein